ncbi:hypothetical protein PPTG_18673 [Phytophthora nicotianae INRA-310]|uniref:RxLR effector protein n=7 Tax=Phytophthora nicotianae TaxID=4792 RepID=W2PH83_PHYN3|nr:hypothetical protein PPTG_18673 [Phytophthora nicotianae INRA-310]ETM99593.1 hypothetical protein PPTG_18673 [Phytophthora nicotianae INRA-310]
MMRGVYILLVAVITLLASCDAASTNKLQLSRKATSNRIQSFDMVGASKSTRFLRVWHFDGDDLKILPLSEVKGILEHQSRQKQYFAAWDEGGVTVKNLAKSLNLNSSNVKWLREFLNRNKKDQVTLLEKYGEHLAALKKNPVGA